MKKLLLGITSLISIVSTSQTKILVYHETNGYRHNSNNNRAIDEGIDMFEAFGVTHSFTVDDSQDSSVFTTSNLQQYSAVVFLNTSGSDESGSDGDLLSASEKAAFEAFIASGKGFVGVHAATDTYRDGVWDFYNELVGGIVQTSPNHTSNNYNADIEVKVNNPITSFLGAVGSTWNKSEEYYYWEQNGGQLSADNTVLLEVEQTGSNSYDAERPITWYKESITYDDDNDDNTPKVSLNGFRSFYTALGHNASDYSSDENFRTMMENAILWAMGSTLSIGQHNLLDFKVSPNPVETVANIQLKNISNTVELKVYDVLGKQVLNKTITPSMLSNGVYGLDVSSLNKGIYLLKLASLKTEKTIKLVKV